MSNTTAVSFLFGVVSHQYFQPNEDAAPPPHTHRTYSQTKMPPTVLTAKRLSECPPTILTARRGCVIPPPPLQYLQPDEGESPCKEVDTAPLLSALCSLSHVSKPDPFWPSCWIDINRSYECLINPTIKECSTYSLGFYDWIIHFLAFSLILIYFSAIMKVFLDSIITVIYKKLASDLETP